MSWRRLGLLGVAITWLSGCLGPEIRPISEPMTTDWHTGGHDRLLVMLPGIDDRYTDFAANGWIEPALAQGFDVVAVDAHFAYYKHQIIEQRLHDDVLAPARAKGYRHIYLVGVSLGGIGGGLTAERYADAVDGLILVAPYVGKKPLWREIANQGGLTRWRSAGAGEPHEIRLWRFLQAETRADRPANRLWLAYGEQDRFENGLALLTDAMDRARVVTGQGRHRWQAWTPLWTQLLPLLPKESS